MVFFTTTMMVQFCIVHKWGTDIKYKTKQRLKTLHKDYTFIFLQHRER